MRLKSLTWVIQFLIDDKTTAEAVETVIDLIQITMIFGSNIISVMNPYYGKWAALLLPFPYLTTQLRLAWIASNKNQVV